MPCKGLSEKVTEKLIELVRQNRHNRDGQRVWGSITRIMEQEHMHFITIVGLYA